MCLVIILNKRFKLLPRLRHFIDLPFKNFLLKIVIEIIVWLYKYFYCFITIIGIVYLVTFLEI